MSTTVVVEPPQPPATSVADLQLNGALSPTRDASPSIVDTTASVVVPGQTPADDTSDVKMTNAQDDDAATQIAVTSAMDTIKEEVVTNATAETVGDVEMAEPTAETKLEPVAYSVRAPEDDARAVALARRRLEIQIAFVENARKKIADETHPDFVSRMVEVDAERERLLELAKHKETYWEHCTSVIFAYECEEANSEFIMNCDKLRQEMLDEIQHEIEIINDARKGAASARKTTRKTRSTRTKTGSEEKSPAQETAQKTKKRVGSVFQYLENKLAQSEVDHDLRELNSSLDALSKKRRIDASSAVESPFVAKYHRANFLYRDAIYQEGDEIYVRNLMNGSEYIAIICSITTTELFVLSEKGKYYRLVVMDLRQGRVLLSPLTPNQTATLNEREVREALRS